MTGYFLSCVLRIFDLAVRISIQFVAQYRYGSAKVVLLQVFNVCLLLAQSFQLCSIKMFDINETKRFQILVNYLIIQVSS